MTKRNTCLHHTYNMYFRYDSTAPNLEELKGAAEAPGGTVVFTDGIYM